jgi:hypothetical protein
MSRMDISLSIETRRSNLPGIDTRCRVQAGNGAQQGQTAA